MNCELMIGLLGAVIGGLLTMFGSIFAVIVEYRRKRLQDWREKQYELFCNIVDLLIQMAEFSGTAKAPLAEAEEVNPISPNCLWSEIVALRKRIIPRISILFGPEMEERVSHLCEDCSENPHIMQDIDELIEEIKKKYFRVR